MAKNEGKKVSRPVGKNDIEKARQALYAAMDAAEVDQNVVILDGLRDTLPAAVVRLGINGLHNALKLNSSFSWSRKKLVDWLDAEGIRPKQTARPEAVKARMAGKERAKAEQAAEPVPEPGQEKGGEWDETVPDAAPEAVPGDDWGPMAPPKSAQPMPPLRSREGMIRTTSGYVSPEVLDREKEAIIGRK